MANLIIDKFYVLNEEKTLIYEVNNMSVYDNANYIYIHLELVSGWDYVNPDYNDIQGWTKAENFIDDIQEEIITMYYMTESMTEALKENGYTILKNIPLSVQKIIDNKEEE